MDTKRTILVVDDDPDIVEQVTTILTADGFRVVAANSLTEAEECLLSVRPNLAIVDLMMEQMDSGFVLCHKLKNLYPEMPIIILTAVTASTGMSFTARSADEKSWIKADSMLDKPVSPQQLKKEVGRLLGLTYSSGEQHHG